jgi:GntR family transcriptional regulator
MARAQVAGAIIVDQLRDRIVSGLYLGHWQPGERLPSIRDIAEAENVDRKTAAAAYRRLQGEGLVRVRARSGVYLRAEPGRDPGIQPLHRLYRRWLEHTYEGARALGLDTLSILEILDAVAAVEERRIPVVEADWTQAESLAHELRDRLHVRTVPLLPGDLRLDDPVVVHAPFIITTPYLRGKLGRTVGERPVIELILSRSFIQELRERLTSGSALVVTPTGAVAEQVRLAFARGQIADGQAGPRVVVAGERGKLLELSRDSTCVFLWPGTPSWVAQELESRDCVLPGQFISDESLARVRLAILDTALHEMADRDGFSKSSAAAPRGRAAAGPGIPVRS